MPTCPACRRHFRVMEDEDDGQHSCPSCGYGDPCDQCGSPDCRGDCDPPDRAADVDYNNDGAVTDGKDWT